MATRAYTGSKIFYIAGGVLIVNARECTFIENQEGLTEGEMDYIMEASTDRPYIFVEPEDVSTIGQENIK